MIALHQIPSEALRVQINNHASWAISAVEMNAPKLFGIPARNHMAPAFDRFCAALRLSPSGCWEWTKSLHEDGYGRFQVDNVHLLAHRYSWETFRGEIPAGAEIDHTCNNRACCNPAHLEPVTHVVNIERAVERRRAAGRPMRAAKTHCRHGHALPPPVFDDCGRLVGTRSCKECARLRQIVRYNEKIRPFRVRVTPEDLIGIRSRARRQSFCRRGHEMPEPIELEDGRMARRRCPVCRNIDNRERYLRKKAAVAGGEIRQNVIHQATDALPVISGVIVHQFSSAPIDIPKDADTETKCPHTITGQLLAPPHGPKTSQ